MKITHKDNFSFIVTNLTFFESTPIKKQLLILKLVNLALVVVIFYFFYYKSIDLSPMIVAQFFLSLVFLLTIFFRNVLEFNKRKNLLLVYGKTSLFKPKSIPISDIKYFRSIRQEYPYITETSAGTAFRTDWKFLNDTQILLSSIPLDDPLSEENSRETPSEIREVEDELSAFLGIPIERSIQTI